MTHSTETRYVHIAFVLIPSGSCAAWWLVADDVDITMTCQLITVALKIVKTGVSIVYFWYLICVANVNNCKPERPPLGGYREELRIGLIEEISREDTIANFYRVVQKSDTPVLILQELR